eukprot:SAG31_NODE_578_length_13949_cov_5.041372_7_plen_109_part_00
MFLTHGAMLKMYHESGGQLKNKIQGLTSHKRQLPEAQRNELLMSRRPELASAAENEAAVLELSDEEDDVDPKVHTAFLLRNFLRCSECCRWVYFSPLCQYSYSNMQRR